jgi:hypothetical protein
VPIDHALRDAVQDQVAKAATVEREQIPRDLLCQRFEDHRGEVARANFAGRTARTSALEEQGIVDLWTVRRRRNRIAAGLPVDDGKSAAQQKRTGAGRADFGIGGNLLATRCLPSCRSHFNNGMLARFTFAGRLG